MIVLEMLSIEITSTVENSLFHRPRICLSLDITLVVFSINSLSSFSIIHTGIFVWGKKGCENTNIHWMRMMKLVRIYSPEMFV
jgi:hypothetical protein